jgi:maltooligosyltrehalose trehalohydrolase
VVVRYYFDDGCQETQKNDRLLLVNLGHDFDLERITEPLLAPPLESGLGGWRMLWSSEDPSYGGHGCAEPCSAGEGWLVPAAATVLLAPAVTKPTGKGGAK